MTLTIDVEQGKDGLRPVFTPEGKPNQSWVGEWAKSTQDLSDQVAREFYQWLMLS